MKTMTRFLKYLGVAAAILMFAAPLHAQINPFRILVAPGEANALSAAVTAVDTAPVILVKYIGPTVQAHTFAVTTFDYIFTVGGAADATINVQATTPCGAAVGTLDTNDADCNTLVELVNEINASPNWLAIPLGGLPADSVDTGGASSGADVVSVVTPQAGTVVYGDSSDNLNTTLTFYPGNRVDVRDYVTGTPAAYKPMSPWQGLISTLQYYVMNYVGTAVTTNGIFLVKDAWTGATGKTWSPTSRQIYGFTGAATGVDKALDFSNAPLFGNRGERFVVRSTSTATHTSPKAVAFGFATK
jgi:hypothetical protein